MRKKEQVLEGLRVNLKRFEEYNEFVENTLSNRLNKIIKKGEILTDEEQDEFFDQHYDEIAKMEDIFPQLLRESLFITIYAFLEDHLLFLCKYCKIERNVPEDVRDNKRDKGIERSCKYLKKVKGITFPDTSNEWSRIKTCQVLRNYMTHNQSWWRDLEIKGEYVMKMLDAKLLKTLQRLPGVVIEEIPKRNNRFKRYQIKLSEKFVQSFIMDVRWILTQVTKII